MMEIQEQPTDYDNMLDGSIADGPLDSKFLDCDINHQKLHFST